MPVKKKSRKKKTNKGKRVFSIIIIIVLIIIAAVAVTYFSWKKSIDTFNTEYAHEIQTNMGEVSYAVMGDGPVVLLIHGEGSGLTNIFKYKDIAEAGYKILCPSRPGYPGTSIELGENISQQSEVLISFLDALQLHQPVIVIAESLAGPIALNLCSQYPGRIKALITVDALSTTLKNPEEFKKKSLISFNGSIAPRAFNNFLTYYFAKIFTVKSFQNIIEKQTTLTEMECKKMAVNMMARDFEKEKYFRYLNSLMPNKIRIEGFNNDLKQTSNFKPENFWKITAPVFAFQSESNALIPPVNGSNISKGVLKGNIYTYKENGSLFWFGREWENIKTRMLSFMKISNKKPSVKNSGLISTWISMEDGTMLTFSNDGKFVVEFPSVEDNKTWNGHFTYEDDKVLFYFTGDDVLCKSKIGEYAVRFPEDKLILIGKKDRCKTRKNKMDGTWFRL